MYRGIETNNWKNRYLNQYEPSKKEFISSSILELSNRWNLAGKKKKQKKISEAAIYLQFENSIKNRTLTKIMKICRGQWTAAIYS